MFGGRCAAACSGWGKLSSTVVDEPSVNVACAETTELQLARIRTNSEETASARDVWTVALVMLGRREIGLSPVLESATCTRTACPSSDSGIMSPGAFIADKSLGRFDILQDLAKCE